MVFCRPYLRQRKICEEYKAKLEEENFYLCSELQTKVDKRLENASEEEISELKSEISTLKSQLYQAKKDVQNKEKIISKIVTIIELANAIDRYADNKATAKDILIDQIKRATRQICQKENNLHQDLVCEQRRRYDAEAERDHAIMRRDLTEEAMDRVISDLQQLRANTQSQVNRILGNITGKQTCIGILLQKKFAL
ncbi:hypothetical protein C1646_776884 [Rhizophagus diaphanus]|nr:hypothetical protein C1646_776884 [Rhizophagus diaphanus] [Rhizophagus sp. MUCL 43196]